jgi:DNA-binding NtrC family response regulator/tetratricopeptide (TPR) repeat protein
MTSPTTSVLTEVEALLQSKKFPEALEKLKGIDRASLIDESYGYLCILFAEVCLYMGDYSSSYGYIDEAIELFRFDSDAEKFARSKFLKGWLLTATGKHAEAREALLEAYTNYLRCEDFSGAARSLNRLSYVSFQTGNVETAVSSLQRCMELYEKIGDEKKVGEVAHNLAYVYFAFGELMKSLSLYDSYPVTEQKHGEKPVMNFFYMSAIPHAFKGDIVTAKKTIAKATPYVEKYPRDKAIYYENLGLISILDGDYKTAEEALKTGLEISLEIAPESALVSQIKRLFGDLYIAMSGSGMDSRFHGNDRELWNDREPRNDKKSWSNRKPGNDKQPSFLRRQESSIALAEKYAKEALAVAEKINERVEIAACYRIFAQVEQQRGTEPTAGQRPGPRRASGGAPKQRGTEPTASGGVPCSEKAREWYKKAIDLFSLIGSRYELAVTRYLAATSGLYHNGERIAMLYLAREYFESEDVAHYVARIDVKLRKIQLPRTKINKSGHVCPTIVAVNPKMKKLVELAENVAESEMTVLLTGVTGTGKDHLARYIHYHSGRPGKFVPFNAAAVQDTMVESELFGSTKGAFTGSRDRAGLFEEADHGTFYLNEVANASAEFQAKLLEVLETRRVRRLGENKTRKVNFRLIAASNQDLQQRMRDNLFRLDLYHRLNEVHIELPPLDQRKEDIPALVEHFLTFAGFNLTEGSEKDMEQLGRILSRRCWPGNVRELEAMMRRLCILGKYDVRRMIDLALERKSVSEREVLLAALEQTGWNRSKAAHILGLTEGTVRYRIKKHKLSKADS